MPTPTTSIELKFEVWPNPTVPTCQFIPSELVTKIELLPIATNLSLYLIDFKSYEVDNPVPPVQLKIGSFLEIAVSEIITFGD